MGQSHSSDETAYPEAYLDDRTIYSASPEDLSRAWEQSNAWDQAQGWTLNRKKTHLAAVPDAPLDLYFPNGELVPKRENVRTLGHEVPFTYNQANKLQRERTDTAIRSCRRLEMLHLSPQLSSTSYQQSDPDAVLRSEPRSPQYPSGSVRSSGLRSSMRLRCEEGATLGKPWRPSSSPLIEWTLKLPHVLPPSGDFACLAKRS